MKKLAVLIAAGAIVGLSGSAFAAPNANSETTGNPGKGNQGCVLKNGDTFKSPGAMLQALSDRDGNPKATVDLYPGSFSTVGELIDKKCGSDAP